MNIYERIKQLRIENELTQSEVAKRMGYKNHSAYAKIEAGMRDISSAQVELLSNIFHVTPAHLMGWEEAEDDELDNQLIQLLTKLTPEEAQKAVSFVQGMLANRAD